MTSTTPKYALPYPDPGDPVNQGDDTMKALAERVEAVFPRVLRGEVTVNVTVGGTAATQVVNFPAGSFSAAPVVVVSALGSAAGNVNASVTLISATQCTVAGVRATAGPQTVEWIAVGAP